jgi:hypothetical protein
MSLRRTSAPSPAPRLHRLFVVLSALAVVGHLYGLYRPTGPPSPGWFPYADKAEHLAGFGAPVCLILLALAHGGRWPGVDDPGSRSRRSELLVVAIFAAHAVLSELAQHFFYVHRTGDPLDALADWAGVTLGWVVARLILRPGRSQQSDTGEPTAVRVP